MLQYPQNIPIDVTLRYIAWCNAKNLNQLLLFWNLWVKCIQTVYRLSRSADILEEALSTELFSVLTQSGWYFFIVHCMMQTAMMAYIWQRVLYYTLCIWCETHSGLRSCFCKHWTSLQWWPACFRLLDSIKTIYQWLWCNNQSKTSVFHSELMIKLVQCVWNNVKLDVLIPGNAVWWAYFDDHFKNQIEHTQLSLVFETLNFN